LAQTLGLPIRYSLFAIRYSLFAIRYSLTIIAFPATILNHMFTCHSGANHQNLTKTMSPRPELPLVYGESKYNTSPHDRNHIHTLTLATTLGVASGIIPYLYSPQIHRLINYLLTLPK